MTYIQFFCWFHVSFLGFPSDCLPFENIFWNRVTPEYNLWLIRWCSLHQGIGAAVTQMSHMYCYIHMKVFYIFWYYCKGCFLLIFKFSFFSFYTHNVNFCILSDYLGFLLGILWIVQPLPLLSLSLFIPPPFSFLVTSLSSFSLF